MTSPRPEFTQAGVPCTFHPDRLTLLRCTRCGRPACPDCLIQAPVGAHCIACVRGTPPDRPLSDAEARRLAAGRERAERRAQGAGRRPSWTFFALLGTFVALGAAAWATPAPVDLQNPGLAPRALALALVVVGTVVSVTLHEWAHAAVAYRGGDTSVRAKGYLTLDLRRYSDPLLSIGFPLLFLLLGGLPLPGGAVWIDVGRLRGRWWRTAVSLAGSAMNLAFGFAVAALLGTGAFAGHAVLAGSLTYLVYIQFGVALLNLLPLPGLDGYGALEPHLPASVRRSIEPFRRYGLIVLLVLLFAGLLDFIWSGALALADVAGLDPSLLVTGALLARMR